VIFHASSVLNSYTTSLKVVSSAADSRLPLVSDECHWTVVVPAAEALTQRLIAGHEAILRCRPPLPRTFQFPA
jgi:hypothetical protein